MTRGGRPTFRGALRCGRFRSLLLAHGLGTLAQLVLALAVGVEVLDRTGSGFWLSTTVALSFVPYLLFSSLAGVLADRCSRSRLVSLVCGTRAVLAAVLAVGVAERWAVPVLVALAAAVAVVATPAYPALAAATPQCVEPEQRPAANALASAVENGAWMLGPGAFGFLVALGLPLPVILAGSAAALAVAAGCAATARLDAPPRSEATGWLADLSVVLVVVLRRPGVRGPLALAVLDNFLYGYLVVAVVLLVRDAGAGADGLGRLNGALAVGALLGTAVVNRVAHRRGARAVLPVMLGLFALSVVGLAFAGTGAPAVVLVAVAGAATLVGEIVAVTLLQGAVDEHTLARVFGVYDQLAVGAIALGSFLAGPLASALDVRSSVALVALCCFAAVLPSAVGALTTGRLTPPGEGTLPAAAPPRVPSWPPTSSSSLPSTSRAVAPSSSSRALPAQRRPSATPSRQR